MTYQFRLFNGSDNDYEAAVTIHNLYSPDRPLTIESAKHQDTQTVPDDLYNRYVCLHNGQIIGSSVHMLAHWYKTPHQFWIGWSILSEHEAAASAPLFAHLKAQLVPYNPQGYIAYTQEDKLIKKQLFEADGFKITQRSPHSQLDVPSFDGTVYDALLAKLEAEGIEFVTLTEYKERDPDWVATYQNAEWEMYEGMPSSEPLVPPLLSKFEKMFSSPGHNSDGHVFAIKGSEIIGMSSVSVNTVMKEKFHTGFTGVKPSHRRKGIATALKAQVIQFAQVYGAKIIETNNEENNPMYTLNLQLGFEPKPAKLEYKKQL